MSRLESIQSEIRAVNIKLSGVAMRWEATHKLYDSAAFLGQGEELDNLRLQLHALLDERLDHMARIMQLTREMMEL